ncbi:MAG: hypothetical protein RID23_16065 [Roseovarius sp.]
MPLNLSERRTNFVTLFDDTYNQPDCRAYYRMLKSLGYSNHAHAVPVFRSLLGDLMRKRGLQAPSVLDFASSYGIVSALVRHDVSAEAFLERYEDTDLDNLNPEEMVRRDADWLADLPESFPGARFAGIDVAGNAVAYGQAIGLFDNAFDEDLERADPSVPLAETLSSTDLIIECGSVAHLMPAALERLLHATAGKRPWIVTSPVRGNERKEAFDLLRDHGLVIDTLGLPPFPHRRFDSLSEQARAIDIARAAGHDTSGFETTGHFYAQIYVARPPEEATASGR